MSYNNVGFIYQPHFNSHKFRVSCNDQLGEKYNYIVVTCSPLYNGVWKYKIPETPYNVWKNGKRPCFEVPIEDCTKIDELTTVKDAQIKKEIKKMQKKWFTSEVKNNPKLYENGKPDWML